MVGRSANIDWSIVSKLLTTSSPIPSDVTFKVVDKENHGGNEAGVQLGHLTLAHVSNLVSGG